MDLKAHIDPNIVTVGDPSTPLSLIDRSSRKKIKKNFRATPHIKPNKHGRYLESISPIRQYTFFSVLH
jgi:hypothetical protein